MPSRSHALSVGRWVRWPHHKARSHCPRCYGGCAGGVSVSGESGVRLRVCSAACQGGHRGCRKSPPNDLHCFFLSFSSDSKSCCMHAIPYEPSSLAANLGGLCIGSSGPGLIIHPFRNARTPTPQTLGDKNERERRSLPLYSSRRATAGSTAESPEQGISRP